MPDPDVIEANKSLSKIKKLCKRISFIFIIVLGLLCIGWVFTISSMIISQVNADGVSLRNDFDYASILLYLAHALVVIALFSVIILIFLDASKGRSPFTIDQVRRLRVISVLLLAYGLVDLAISCNNTLIQLNSMNYGYVSTSDSATMPINMGPFLAAAIVFAFSFVFKYGVLLQEFSDDTL